MQRCALSALALLLWACPGVSTEPPPSTDAFVSTQIKFDMGTGEPTERPDLESGRAIFQSRQGTYSFTMSGSITNELCEGSVGQLDASGERVLCVPDSISSPLRYHDLLSGPLYDFEGWAKVEGIPSTLARSGDRFATAVLDEEEREQLIVMDVFRFELARLRAIIFHGFAGPEHLVVNDPPSIWAYEEEGSEPVSIGSDEIWVRDDEPYGVVYEQAGAAYFFPVDGSAGERLIAGKIMDLHEDRLLMRQNPESGRGYAFVLYDLTTREERGRVEVERVGFSRSLKASLISRFAALLEEQESQRCDGETRSYSLKTSLADFRRGTERLVYESEAPHLATAHELSPYALVTEVDPCARPNGELRLWKLSEQLPVALPERIVDARWGRFSERGGWLALWGDNGGWLLSTDLSLISTVRSNDPVYDVSFIPSFGENP